MTKKYDTYWKLFDGAEDMTSSLFVLQEIEKLSSRISC